RPSAVQAADLLSLRLKVSCFGFPFGVRSLESVDRKISLRKGAKLRLKSKRLPSGENAGVSSLSPAGGDVSLRFSPVSTESSHMLPRSGVASHWPFGYQARPASLDTESRSVSLRSGPTIAGTRKTAAVFPDRARRKAI